jgi:hypothetical protein
VRHRIGLLATAAAIGAIAVSLVSTGTLPPASAARAAEERTLSVEGLRDASAIQQLNDPASERQASSPQAASAVAQSQARAQALLAAAQQEAQAAAAAQAAASQSAAAQAAAQAAASESAAAQSAAAQSAAARSAAAQSAAQAAAARSATARSATAHSATAPAAAASTPATTSAPAAAPATDNGTAGADAYRAYARSKVGAAQFSCLDALWNKESGWRPSAKNPSSTAYGIPQLLNATWAATGIARTSNGYRQVDAGLIYIDAAYGSPCAAWSHSKATGWY